LTAKSGTQKKAHTDFAQQSAWYRTGHGADPVVAQSGGHRTRSISRHRSGARFPKHRGDVVQDRMTFAALLSAAMGAANLTRYALAEQVGVGRAVVGKWLAGVPSGDVRTKVLPLPDTLNRILDVFPEDVGASLRVAYLRERGLAEQEPTNAPR
jgi:hypothetical protein